MLDARPMLFLAALVSGALLAGASLPAPCGPLAFVALVPLLRLLAGAPPLGLAFRAGCLAGALCYGIGFAWVVRSQVGGGLHPALVYAFAILALALGFGAFALAVAWIARRSPALALAAAPGLWVAVEFARAPAVPWHHLGYALADQPFLVQGASLVGLYGLSAWVVAVNAGLAGMPRLPRAARLGLAAALAAPLALGLPLLREPAPADAGRLRVAAVQPAIDEGRRHEPARLHENLRQLLELSEPLASERADLLVWPESAWERSLGASGDAFLAAIAHHLGTPLVTGAWRAPAAEGASWHNTAVLATREGRTEVVAEKVHPLPFYERAPEGPAARLLARAGLWSGRFGRGRPSEPLVLPRAGAAPVRIGVLVCIDASHPELARASRAAGAQLLVAISNEAGTGPWSAALHARAARVRAVENRVPVVRVANTGPTLWIDARGRVVAELAAGAAASAVHAVALAEAPPARRRPGDRSVAASCFISALAMAAARLARARRGVES